MGATSTIATESRNCNYRTVLAHYGVLADTKINADALSYGLGAYYYNRVPSDLWLFLRVHYSAGSHKPQRLSLKFADQ